MKLEIQKYIDVWWSSFGGNGSRASLGTWLRCSMRWVNDESRRARGIDSGGSGVVLMNCRHCAYRIGEICWWGAGWRSGDEG